MVRLNKFISDSGYCSRREADTYIQQERVTVNGKVAQMGWRVQSGDDVRVDGEKIKSKTQDNTIVIAFNKPPRIVCTTDRNEKGNIIDYINFKKRIFPIGRLDKLAEGLVLLTNDGDLSQQILKSGKRHDKEYLVTVDKKITSHFINNMSSGVLVDGKMTRKCEVEQIGYYQFRIIINQGFYRQVRKMCEHFDMKVKKLTRVRVMNIPLKGIGIGEWRHLTPEEVNELRKSAGRPQKGTQDLRKRIGKSKR